MGKKEVHVNEKEIQMRVIERVEFVHNASRFPNESESLGKKGKFHVPVIFMRCYRILETFDMLRATFD